MTGSDDDFEGVELDDAFVRAGRHEPSADERRVNLGRIARGNSAYDAWRAGPPLALIEPPRRRRHALRTVVLVLSVALGLLVVLAWVQEQGVVKEPSGGAFEAGEPRAVARPAAPVEASSAGAPQRLAPLPPDPGGEGGYRFLEEQDGEPGQAVAYDPCRPVRYVVRREGEPAGADALVEAAIGQLSAATGLVFERGPDTDEAPDDRRDVVQPHRYGPGAAPVLIAWSDEQESPDLAGYIAGYATSTTWGWDAPGSLRYVTGMVVLDADAAGELLAERGGEAAVQSTVLHELGHLVGLAHVADRDQLMFSEGGENRLELGAGDRRGLRALGAGACFSDWDELLSDAG